MGAMRTMIGHGRKVPESACRYACSEISVPRSPIQISFPTNPLGMEGMKAELGNEGIKNNSHYQNM